jgi:hypothetical protein
LYEVHLQTKEPSLLREVPQKLALETWTAHRRDLVPPATRSPHESCGMSARTTVDTWVCDHCRAGLSGNQLIRLMRRDSAVALWNWRHKKVTAQVAGASERTSAPNTRILAP